ncbi:PSMC3 interacting protein [Actinomortierella ambigua]|uniref:Homologous-pairing protein 2 homolog n=1 Tax=Actinomortierella ambigua TaxID=1343610 RepID=A0A9P6Q0H1_9FUNG|nr:PSMC3 interacting protein [Actinomortierella ambigua]
MPKEKKSTGAEKTILEYLTKQNRPYGVTEIASNLHNTIGKAELQKALASLVDLGKVVTKLYGKQAIYCVNQENLATATSQELAQMDQALSRLQNQLAELKADNKQLSSKLSSMNSALPTDEIIQRAQALAAKNQENSSRLEQLRTGTQLVSASERQKVVKEMELHRKLWIQRRRLFKDMFGAMTENMPGRPKDLLEELGIEANDPVDILTTPSDLMQ